HLAVGAPAAGAPRRRRLARPTPGSTVRRTGRVGHGAGIRRRQRAAPGLSGRRDLPGRERRWESGGAVSGRPERDAAGGGRPGGAAAARRTSPVARRTAVGPG